MFGLYLLKFLGGESVKLIDVSDSKEKLEDSVRFESMYQLLSEKQSVDASDIFIDHYIIVPVDITKTTCSKCGETSNKGPCPYDSDIYSIETICDCCESCRDICSVEI